MLGTMHAWHAVERGHDVLHIEREAEARGASVRNFGQIWISGRAGGEELTTALRARELWEGIGARVPGLGFRAIGSLTVARNAAELAVAEAAARRPDAAARGYRLLDAGQARDRNPALRGEFAGALWCERDAAVEPRTAQRVLKEVLLGSGRYTYLGGREVREVVGERAVRDDHGDRPPRRRRPPLYRRLARRSGP